MDSLTQERYDYFHYILIIKKSFTLISDIAPQLGKYLIRRIEKQLKKYDTEVMCLAIEHANKAGQPHIHILIRTKLDRDTLLKELETIKRNTVPSLQAQKVIPKGEEIFSRYRGEMNCKFYRDKGKCLGRENCSNTNKEGNLKCRENNNLKNCKYKSYLDNVFEYISKKKEDVNCLFLYEKS